MEILVVWKVNIVLTDWAKNRQFSWWKKSERQTLSWLQGYSGARPKGGKNYFYACGLRLQWDHIWEKAPCLSDRNLNSSQWRAGFSVWMKCRPCPLVQSLSQFVGQFFPSSKPFKKLRHFLVNGTNCGISRRWCQRAEWACRKLRLSLSWITWYCKKARPTSTICQAFPRQSEVHFSRRNQTSQAQHDQSYTWLQKNRGSHWLDRSGADFKNWCVWSIDCLSGLVSWTGSWLNQNWTCRKAQSLPASRAWRRGVQQIHEKPPCGSNCGAALWSHSNPDKETFKCVWKQLEEGLIKADNCL